MEDLLNNAKSYKEKKDFKKAAEYFEYYITESKSHASESVYIKYVDCLKRGGGKLKFRQALQDSLKIYPESASLLRELYEVYYSSYERKDALLIAKSLVNLEPNNSGNYFLVGKANASLGEIEKAKTSYMRGLEYKHNMSIDTLIDTIESGFTKDISEITTEYTFIAGTSNYGAFIHHWREKKFFTKISKATKRAKREEMFYRDVCKDFPNLTKQVPSFIGSKEIGDILYLTIELIDGFPLKHARIDNILKSSQFISSISYKAIAEKYSNPKYPYKVNTPNRLIECFTRIHQEKYSKRLFLSLYNFTKKEGYPLSIIKIIEDLEAMVVDNKLHNYVIPSEHYSLVHGDFNRRNAIFKKGEGKVVVFDWEFFKIGPHFIDIARYLTVSLIPYSEVKKVYIDNDEMGGKLSLIEKIYFLYILILLYILTLGKKRVENELESCILPALQHMRLLVNEFEKKNN